MKHFFFVLKPGFHLRKPDWILLAVLLFAAVVRMSWITSHAEQLTQDTDSYQHIAGNLAYLGVYGTGIGASPDAIGPTAMRPPRYPLLLALVVSTLLGSGLNAVLVAVGLALMPGYVRLMAGQVLSTRQNEYVMAARAVGAGQRVVMFRHILPNCLSPLIVQVTLVIGLAILIEATLSFLGLGIKPPTAAWGSMVYDGYRYLALRPVLSLGPGLAIMLAVFAFNMVGDGLRDALDPRLRNIL